MSLDGRNPPARSFVLPVYNAAPFLLGNLKVIRAWLASRPEPWELIVVDDASIDATPRILDGFLRDHPGDAIVRVRFMANRGKGFATRVGLGLAHPVENTARIVRTLEEGADAAIACRVLKASVYMMSPSFFSYLYTRHVMGRMFNWICRLLTVPGILDTQAGL